MFYKIRDIKDTPQVIEKYEEIFSGDENDTDNHTLDFWIKLFEDARTKYGGDSTVNFYISEAEGYSGSSHFDIDVTRKKLETEEECLERVERMKKNIDEEVERNRIQEEQIKEIENKREKDCLDFLKSKGYIINKSYC